jgi:hypothetical protein
MFPFAVTSRRWVVFRSQESSYSNIKSVKLSIRLKLHTVCYHQMGWRIWKGMWKPWRYKLYIHVTVHHYRFIFNNQPDALIIQIYSVIKLNMFWDNFFAHHQEFSTVHSASVSFMQVLMTVSKHNQFYSNSAWKRSSKPACRAFSRKLLMMGKEVARNM